MKPLQRPATEDALAAVFGQISDVAGSLTESDALRPTRCAGWTVIDVLYHLLMDARLALCTFASPAAGQPDTDYVSYWRPYAPTSGASAALGSEGAARHARQVRIIASTYSPAMLAYEWRETAEAALRAARACRHEALAIQGQVMPTADFIATLVVEAAIHYLDLSAELPAVPVPHPAPLALVRDVLEALAGSALPSAWDDATCALKGTGRLGLTDAERSALGSLADKLPLFG